jgi:FkbM family methyltransferase
MKLTDLAGQLYAKLRFGLRGIRDALAGPRPARDLQRILKMAVDYFVAVLFQSDPLTISYRQARNWFERRRYAYQHTIGQVAPRIRPDATIMDVGANIGFFSLLLMDALEFEGEAHLFEIVPQLMAHCRETFASTPYHVVFHDYGLSNADETVTVYTATNGNIGWNTVIGEKTDASMKRIEAPVRAFDSLSMPPLDFVKIDVEGAEHKVIEGMMGYLQNADTLPLFLIELGWLGDHPDRDAYYDTFDRLVRLGYAVTDLQDNPLDIRSLQGTTDVLFVPIR